MSNNISWSGPRPSLEVLAIIMQERDDLQARIAALEAQITAQGWRPVTEPPIENGDYLVYCWPGEYEVMTFWDGYWAGGIPVYYWQPLPAPPQDAE